MLKKLLLLSISSSIAFASFALVAKAEEEPTLYAETVMTSETTESDNSSDDSVELLEVTATTDIDSYQISTEEITTEAEPSVVPEAAVDQTLTDQVEGSILLDVEGSGEAYYVDPQTGSKEYLADGEAAYSLLRRSGLGIKLVDLNKISVGTTKDDSSVCKVSGEIGNRLKGRIVISVEEKGEAWYIFPKNCRRYYVGTFDKAYEVMKSLSLGITKANLGKIADSKREIAKRALKKMVLATAEDKGVSIEEARTMVKTELQEAKECAKTKLGDLSKIEKQILKGERKASLAVCVQQTDLPKVNAEKALKVREAAMKLREVKVKAKMELKNKY